MKFERGMMLELMVDKGVLPEGVEKKVLPDGKELARGEFLGEDEEVLHLRFGDLETGLLKADKLFYRIVKPAATQASVPAEQTQEAPAPAPADQPATTPAPDSPPVASLDQMEMQPQSEVEPSTEGEKRAEADIADEAPPEVVPEDAAEVVGEEIEEEAPIEKVEKDQPMAEGDGNTVVEKGDEGTEETGPLPVSAAPPTPPMSPPEFGKELKELSAEVGRARDAEARAEKRIQELEKQLNEAQADLVEANDANCQQVSQLEKEHGEKVVQLLQELEVAKTQRDESHSRLCAILADGTFAASVKLQDTKAELDVAKAALEQAKFELGAVKDALFQETRMRRQSETEAERMALMLANTEKELAPLKKPLASKPPAVTTPSSQGVPSAKKKKSWWR